MNTLKRITLNIVVFFFKFTLITFGDHINQSLSNNIVNQEQQVYTS